MTAVEKPARIKKLEESVVNRIAAGEIIVGPSNALKELLENSIDAGSTRIDIVCKDGGIKLLQLTDNGSGIDKDDFGILCERHTTSKLKDYEDLASIATYGFRGEALASISHVSHLTITSRTVDSKCAYRGKFLNGSLQEEPKPIAGNQGTQITVEDLYYNYEARLRAFKSPNEEYQRILDVAVKYGIHSAGVGISCKRYGSTQANFSMQNQWSVQDRIRSFYGSEIANELVEVNIPPLQKYGITSGTMHATNANFSSKKNMPYIIFINHRLVTCAPLQRAISQTYSTFLPKGGHAFVYVSLELEPSNLDVNVHPTKREVRFLWEEEIVDSVSHQLQEALSKLDSSRSFPAQTLISKSSSQRPPSSNPSYPHHQVRTDHSQQSLASLISSSKRSQIVETVSERAFKQIKLDSVMGFRHEVVKSAHKSLTQIFAEHSYIGVVDFSRRLGSIQHGVKLYLVDYGLAAKELFYQIALSEFGNFGVVELAEPLDLKELIEIATANADEVKECLDILSIEKMQAMLQEYFSILFEEDEETGAMKLKTMPLLLSGYTFPVFALPDFFLRISKADWDDEVDCLKTILLELAELHVPAAPSDDDEESETMRQELSSSLEHVLFPAFKKRLTATKELAPALIELASLPGLYRVFERC